MRYMCLQRDEFNKGRENMGKKGIGWGKKSWISLRCGCSSEYGLR